MLENKIAVVTGAAQGIGLAIATRFLDEGATVIISDRDEQAATFAAAAFDTDRVVAVRCDVTSESDVGSLIRSTVDRFGRVDIMVNNAGVTRDATMPKMTLEDFRLVLDVHLVGTWLGCKTAGAVMRDQQSGAIVNLSSIAGKVGNFGQTNYSAAKAGIVGMTKAAAKELARHGVRVNAIQPGLIRTAMTEAMPPKAWEAKMSEIPMSRAGEPAEVAAVAAFLSSDLSSYMTGTVLEVTGGRYM